MRRFSLARQVILRVARVRSWRVLSSPRAGTRADPRRYAVSARTVQGHRTNVQHTLSVRALSVRAGKRNGQQER
jgi:hypothetical protein